MAKFHLPGSVPRQQFHGEASLRDPQAIKLSTDGIKYSASIINTSIQLSASIYISSTSVTHTAQLVASEDHIDNTNFELILLLQSEANYTPTCQITSSRQRNKKNQCQHVPNPKSTMLLHHLHLTYHGGVVRIHIL